MNAKPRKELERELQDISKSIPDLKQAVSFSQSNLSKAEKRLTKLTAILNTAAIGPTVSDHAVLRYLERKFNLDINGIRDEILTPNAKTAIEQGATAIKSGGMEFRVRNKTITTCL